METCVFCKRKVPSDSITDHHLTPKNRKESEVVNACVPCHKQLHAIFTHHELKHEYTSVSEICNHPEMEKFIEWISKTDKLDIQVDESKHVREWRR